MVMRPCWLVQCRLSSLFARSSTIMAVVLVAGAPGVGKATLLHGLQASRVGKDPCLYDLCLETKYYTADLLVHCQQAYSGDTTSHPALDQLQALVLVVDATSKSSHDAAMSFYKALPESEFEIQLLVANKVDSLQQQGQDSSIITRPAWLEDARTWCYSNGFEYIEAAAGKPNVDATLHEDGEQQGVGRVLAALQAHMWPSMQQKSRKQQTSQHPAAMPGCSSNSSSSKDQGHGPPVTAADAGQHPQPSTKALDAVPTPKQQQPAQQSAAAAGEQNLLMEGKPGPSQQQPAVGAAAAAGGDGADDDDPFLGIHVDDFEQLMRQVMGR